MFAKSFIIAASLATSVLATATTGCNADNCARAVTGTRDGKTPSVPSRSADCASFQLTTVTPDTFTTTVATVTVWTPAPAKREVEERMVAARAVTVIPTNVPAYASPCSGVARYASACSCWGITATVSTAPTPTATVTATVYKNDHCNPARGCADYGNGGLFECPVPGGTAQCSCGKDADGVATCFHHGGCSPCSHNSDCDPSNVCVTDTCCGQPVCLPRLDTCPNIVSKRALFGRAANQGVKRSDCQSPSCGN